MSDLDQITTESNLVTPRDQQIAQLETQLQDEKDARKHDRFILSIIGIFLVDGLWGRDASLGGATVLIFINVVLLLALARYCGVDYINTIIQNGLDAANIFRGGKGKD